MEELHDLLLLGLSHRSAPAEVRSRYAVQAEDLQSVLRDIVGLPHVMEALIVSTCNRTEVLLLSRAVLQTREDLAQRLFRNLSPDALYAHEGLAALIHFFRLAAGLDSQVLGESEILGQVRRAADVARAAGTLGKGLDPLVQQALSAGKHVRQATSLGEGTLSIARVAVDAARHVFGELAERQVLIVGAGETGRLFAKHLLAAGPTKIDFANRTLASAEEAVRETGGRAFALERLGSALLCADLVALCVDNAGDLLRAEHFDRRALSRRDRPFLILDLSIPRAAQATLRELPGVLLIDLDDLVPVIEQHQRQRGDAREQADTLLVQEVHKFLALRTYAAFRPAIAELMRGFEAAREEVLDEVTGGSAAARELELAHALTKRLLDLSLAQLKEGARAARSEEALDRAYRRYLENQ